MAENKSKIALFWVITILFPFLLLALIEIGFRLAGYNDDAQDLFIEAPTDSKFLIANTNFVSRYFPSFVPQVAPNAFRKQKQSNTFRIFVFGGSSTQGFPYNFYHGFSDVLEQKLLLETNGLNIEVINLGMTAVNSYVIRDLSKRVMPYEPDAILIYAGHNEYYGSFGAASTQFGLVNNVGLKRLIISLKNLRLYQFLEDIMKPEETEDGDRRTMMARVVRESNIELDGEIYNQGIDQFEKNIESVLKRFQKRDIPVFISTIGSNLKDQAPLSDVSESLTAYSLAEDLFNEGDIDVAFNSYMQAKEQDGIRFRAPNSINEVIRNLASSNNINLIDGELLLRQNSDSGIEDESLFIDHLHPNSDGHRLLANAFFEELIKLRKLTNAYSPNSFDVPQVVSQFEEVYSNTSISRLLVGYPFQKGLTVEDELSAFQIIYDGYQSSSYIDSIATTAARTQRTVALGLTDVVNHSEQRGDSLKVVSHYYELLKWQLNSTNLIEKGVEYGVNTKGAETYLVNMLTQILNDGGYDPRYMDVLSAVYLLNNELTKASYWLEQSERRGSNSAMFNYNYARFHFLNGDTASAAMYYNRFINAQGN